MNHDACGAVGVPGSVGGLRIFGNGSGGEARTRAGTREAAGLPPAEMIVGQAGGYAAPDMTHQAELARYEKKYPRRPLPPPDPRYLAQNYLEKAGFPRNELDRAIPLLDEAEKNMTWERQITGAARHGNWTP